MKLLNRKIFSSCIVLINPNRSLRRVKKLERFLHQVEAPHVFVSRDVYQFERHVRDFGTGDMLCLLIHGGDGTIHRALNALVPLWEKDSMMHCKQIGFLRGGSGNGYHDSYGTPTCIKRQLRALADSIVGNYSVDVDILHISQGGHHYYGQLLGIGFDVDVLKRRKRQGNVSSISESEKTGLLNYIRSTLISLRELDMSLNREKVGFTLTLREGFRMDVGSREKEGVPFQQHTVKTHAPMIDICKRPYYGNKFRVCPDAVCNDGMIEVKLFNYKSKLFVIVSMIALWLGWHRLINGIAVKGKGPVIERYRTRNLCISSTQSFDFHVDGELITSEWNEEDEYRIDVALRPRAVSILVPEAYYKKIF